MQAEGQKNVYPLSERELPNAAPSILADTITSGIFTQGVVISGLSHLGQVSSAIVTCTSTSTGTQVQGSILAYVTSCARPTGLEISQTSLKQHFLSENQGRKGKFTFGIHFPPRKFPHVGHFGGLCLVT